jgi:hypothetical protein
MLENYPSEEIAQIPNVSPARVEWFMRKIEGWRGEEEDEESEKTLFIGERSVHQGEAFEYD